MQMFQPNMAFKKTKKKKKAIRLLAKGIKVLKLPWKAKEIHKKKGVVVHSL